MPLPPDDCVEATTSIHVMKWKGSKTPYGATIGGVEVFGSQHGRLSGADGEELGWYARTIEFGGTDGDEHAMQIELPKGVTAANPDGTECLLAYQIGAGWTDWEEVQRIEIPAKYLSNNQKLRLPVPRAQIEGNSCYE